MGWLSKLLYGGDPDLKRLDKLAQSRPTHQNFSDLAKRLSSLLGGNRD